MSNRCLICDWCPTAGSLFNPEAEQYANTRLEFDDILNDYVCSTCLKVSNRMIRNAKASDDDYIESRYIVDPMINDLELFGNSEEADRENVYHPDFGYSGSRKKAVRYD